MTFILAYFQHLTDLYFVYKYGRETALEYFRVYDHVDRTLNMTYYNVIKRNISYLMIFITISAVSCILFDGFLRYMFVNWSNATIECLNNLYFLVLILIVIDIIAHITQVQFRLKLMGDVLEDFYLSTESLPEVMKEIIITIKDQPKNEKVTNHLDLLKTICLNRNYSILKLSRCYLLLLEQTDFINTIFGIRVVKVNISIWYPLASIILHLYTRGSIILCALYRVEQNFKELKRIVRVVDLILINKKINIETKDALKQLRDLVISRPVQFHAVNFFTLDYRLLVSITSVVVTYTLIFLQYVK
ncbi:uncharacterized protein [Epargyreus clarus]|uniref:uncharacterized protein n=1 Tax=Epargyreus clarus TaxID=520877 RepID=UPI003C2BA490